MAVVQERSRQTASRAAHDITALLVVRVAGAAVAVIMCVVQVCSSALCPLSTPRTRRPTKKDADEDRFDTAEDANANAAQELSLPATSETDEPHTGELDGSFEAAQAAGEAGAHAHAKA